MHKSISARLLLLLTETEEATGKVDVSILQEGQVALGSGIVNKRSTTLRRNTNIENFISDFTNNVRSL